MLRIAFPRLAVFLAALLVAMPGMAQSWPDRPLKFIVSAPAGARWMCSPALSPTS